MLVQYCPSAARLCWRQAYTCLGVTRYTISISMQQAAGHAYTPIITKGTPGLCIHRCSRGQGCISHIRRCNRQSWAHRAPQFAAAIDRQGDRVVRDVRFYGLRKLINDFHDNGLLLPHVQTLCLTPLVLILHIKSCHQHTYLVPPVFASAQPVLLVQRIPSTSLRLLQTQQIKSQMKTTLNEEQRQRQQCSHSQRGHITIETASLSLHHPADR